MSKSTSLPISEWQKQLAGVHIAIISKTLDCTSQLAMIVECENREIPRQYHNSRFPVIKKIDEMTLSIQKHSLLVL